MTQLRTLADIEVALGECLGNIQAQLMHAGELLTKAKEFFEAGADWLAWAKDVFGLGKTYVFKLVKVYTVFGTDTRFKGVALQALYLLAQCGDDKVVEAAAELARDGQLTITVISELIDPAKPAKAKAAPAKVKAAPAEVEEEEEGVPFEGSVPRKDTASTASTDSTASAAPAAPTEAAPAQVSEDLRALVKELEALRTQLAEAQAENMQLRKDMQAKAEVKVAVLPTLPHLKSDDMRVRLGLTVAQADDLAQVKKESRHLLKLFKGNDEATKLVKEATAALLA